MPAKVFQKDLAMIICFILLYAMVTFASVHSDYGSGKGGILPLPQEVCEARFSVLPLCLPANKNPMSFLLFNASQLLVQLWESRRWTDCLCDERRLHVERSNSA